MIDGLITLWRGFLGHCPHCGYGRIFRSFFGLVEGCAQCGRRYEGTGDQSAGAMGISLTVTMALGFIGGILLVLFAPDHLVPGMVALLVILSGFQAIAYRLSRGLWIGLLALTGAMDEDEHRDEFYI